MKTKIKIIAMLMSMTIGTLAASAQSARGSSHSEKSRSSSTVKAQKKPSSTRQSHTSTRSNSPKATQTRTPSRSSSKATQTRTVTRSSTPKATTSQRTTTQKGSRSPVVAQRSRSQKTSTTTRYNPNSNYRTANKTVNVNKTYRDPKASRSSENRTTYGVSHNNKITNTYHRNVYYPAKKVKIHVHPMTYRSNYKVLYYPRYSEIVWTRTMHRHYIGLYPSYSGWHYNLGYRIQTISAFDAKYNVGEIARVYGRVYGTWYNADTDDLLLFFGGEYPYQEFTMVIPGSVARRYSWRPEKYFLGQHVSATGLISGFDGKAEMVVKRKTQIDVY